MFKWKKDVNFNIQGSNDCIVSGEDGHVTIENKI